MPYITLAIFIVTVLVSLPHLNRPQREAEHSLNSASMKALFAARSALLIEACPQLKFDQTECRFLKDNLNPQHQGNPLVLLGQLSVAAHREFGQKLGEQRTRLWTKYLVGDGVWSRTESAKDWAPLTYPAYSAALGAFREETLARQQAADALSATNWNWRSLGLAQLTHAGWMHLLGNMIFFLLFAIAVEERIGAPRLLAVYVLGGSIGLSLQLAMGDDPVKGLIGASANVFAVAGMFLALFWNRDIRVWISWFFAVNRTAFVPTWVFILIYILLGEIEGAIRSTSNVGHVAHLGGMSIGWAAGFFISRRQNLAHTHVFPFEAELLHEAALNLNLEERLHLVHQILFHNPENAEAQDLLVGTIMNLPEREWTQLPLPAQNALRLNFGALLARRLRESTPVEMSAFIAWLPASWPLHELSRGFNAAALVKAGLAAEQTGDLQTATRLYQVIIKNGRPSAFRTQVEAKWLALERQRRVA